MISVNLWGQKRRAILEVFEAQIPQQAPAQTGSEEGLSTGGPSDETALRRYRQSNFARCHGCHSRKRFVHPRRPSTGVRLLGWSLRCELPAASIGHDLQRGQNVLGWAVNAVGFNQLPVACDPGPKEVLQLQTLAGSRTASRGCFVTALSSARLPMPTWEERRARTDFAAPGHRNSASEPSENKLPGRHAGSVLKHLSCLAVARQPAFPDFRRRSYRPWKHDGWNNTALATALAHEDPHMLQYYESYYQFGAWYRWFSCGA